MPLIDDFRLAPKVLTPGAVRAARDAELGLAITRQNAAGMAVRAVDNVLV